MRVKCQVKIVNRSALQNGIGYPKKPSQAVLFVARKSGYTIYLVLCTAKDRDGIKFEVKDNILKIFPKYLDEGKTTIQLKTPQIDLFISNASPQKLKLLLHSIKQAHCGVLTNIGVLSSFIPAKLKHLQKPSHKLVVTSRADYPLTVDFPANLKELSASNCSLARFDSRILSINSLSVLDLSCNRIKLIPDSLSQMKHLSLLNLSQNEISLFPNSLCYRASNLCQSLKYLDISKNNLVTLPETFCNLSALQNLLLNNNQLQRLPRDLERLNNLQQIFASHNCIKFLPGSMLNMRNLDKVDFFMNPFLPLDLVEAYNRNIKQYEMRRLQNITAQAIKTLKIPYNDINRVPYPLIQYLNNAVKCCCNSYCFEENASSLIFRDLRSICENVTSLDISGGYKAIFLIPHCSHTCKPVAH